MNHFINGQIINQILTHVCSSDASRPLSSFQISGSFITHIEHNIPDDNRTRRHLILRYVATITYQTTIRNHDVTQTNATYETAQRKFPRTNRRDPTTFRAMLSWVPPTYHFFPCSPNVFRKHSGGNRNTFQKHIEVRFAERDRFQMNSRDYAWSTNRRCTRALNTTRHENVETKANMAKYI